MQAEGSYRAPIDLPSTAAYLGTSTRHVRNLVARREIPYTKVGRLVRFRPDELDRWLDERTVRDEAGVERARQSREQQGLPPTIEDPAVLARVADLLETGERS